MVDFDTRAKERFRGRAAPWVARWLFGRPSDAYFYAMAFRSEIGRTVVHEAGVNMPDVEMGVKKLHSLGLITPDKEAPKVRANQLNYRPVIVDRWEPYLDFWIDHLERHPGEIVVADSVKLSDVLLQEILNPSLAELSRDTVF